MQKNKKAAGQALVEYSLILVLVGVVVIVVLALLGPTIGNVFSETLDGLQLTQVAQSTPIPTLLPTEVPSPTPTPTWTFCANEDDFCSFTGAKEVRYGANHTYYYRTFTDGTACTNGVFGDPLYGVFKHCYYR